MCLGGPNITIPPAPPPVSASRVVLDQLAPDLSPDLQRKESTARSRKKGTRRLQITLNLPGAISGSGLIGSGASTNSTVTKTSE